MLLYPIVHIQNIYSFLTSENIILVSDCYVGVVIRISEPDFAAPDHGVSAVAVVVIFQ